MWDRQRSDKMDDLGALTPTEMLQLIADTKASDVWQQAIDEQGGLSYGIMWYAAVRYLGIGDNDTVPVSFMEHQAFQTHFSLNHNEHPQFGEYGQA